MNKNAFLITVTLASSLFWAGCNKSGKLDQASTFTTPTGPVELKPKWPAGEHVVQSFDMKLGMEMSVPGQPNPIKQDIALGQKYGLTVLKADAGGGPEVELEFLGLRMKIEQGGRTLMDYDSEEKPSNDHKDRAAAAIQKLFQNIIGAKIQYFLDASNQVERIEGVDALMNRLTTGGRADGTDSIKSMFNEGSLKQMIGGRDLPSKPVQPGDTWPVQMDIVMGDLGKMVMDYTYSFERWEQHGKRNCARLEFQGTIKSKPDPDSKPKGMTVSVQDGSSSGVSWFDPELGMVIETTMNQDMKMNMTMPVNGRGKQTAQTMTSLMHQTITIKLESVK